MAEHYSNIPLSHYRIYAFTHLRITPFRFLFSIKSYKFKTKTVPYIGTNKTNYRPIQTIAHHGWSPNPGASQGS